MSLSSAAVDAIFARMAVRYGSAWFTKWGHVPIEAVKADWAQVLAGARQDAIVYALGYLPLEFPPTATQFREICARAPDRRRTEQELLDAPKPDPERLKRELIRLHELLSARSRLAWAHDLQERERAGDALTDAQRAAWRKAIAETPIHELHCDGAGFCPIPEYALPPGMREEVSEAERMSA